MMNICILRRETGRGHDRIPQLKAAGRMWKVQERKRDRITEVAETGENNRGNVKLHGFVCVFCLYFSCQIHKEKNNFCISNL